MTSREKLAAKISNERVKLLVGLLNSLAGAAVIGSIVSPFVAGAANDPLWSVLVTGLGGVLHLLGQLALGFLKLGR